MEEYTFSDLGRVEAIAKLYEGTPYKPFETSKFEVGVKSVISSSSRTFIEGIDFDLTYFPLKHLGYTYGPLHWRYGGMSVPQPDPRFRT